MNHLLIDFDSKIPNLALMKISAWAKGKGGTVTIIREGESPWLVPDEIWLSCIFTWNKDKGFLVIASYKAQFPKAKVHYGGSGFDWGLPYGDPNRIYLPSEIEAMVPDYSLYDDDRAVGFCQRGCDRRCPWCNVWKSEGRIKQNDFRRLREWVPDGFKKVLLLDNDIALAEKWKHDLVLHDAREMGVKLSITQGYDIREINEEKAQMLADYKPWSLNFKERMLYFSWDEPGYEKMVRRGIELLKDAGFKGRQMTCYVLVGFDTTHEQDMHRVNILWKEYGILPYIMPFNNKRDDQWINNLRRWANRRWLLKTITFEEYNRNFRGTDQYKEKRMTIANEVAQ